MTPKQKLHRRYKWLLWLNAINFVFTVVGNVYSVVSYSAGGKFLVVPLISLYFVWYGWDASLRMRKQLNED